MIYLNTLLAEAKLKLNIPSDIKKLHKLFKKNGKQLYVVGGAVRDAILGKSPKDFDLTTDAKPDEVLDIAKQGGCLPDLSFLPMFTHFCLNHFLKSSSNKSINLIIPYHLFS